MRNPLTCGAYSCRSKTPKKVGKRRFRRRVCESFDQSKLSAFFQRPLKLGAEKDFFFLEASKHGFFKGEEDVDGKKPGAKSREPPSGKGP